MCQCALCSNCTSSLRFFPPGVSVMVTPSMSYCLMSTSCCISSTHRSCWSCRAHRDSQQHETLRMYAVYGPGCTGCKLSAYSAHNQNPCCSPSKPSCRAGRQVLLMLMIRSYLGYEPRECHAVCSNGSFQLAHPAILTATILRYHMPCAHTVPHLDNTTPCCTATQQASCEWRWVRARYVQQSTSPSPKRHLLQPGRHLVASRVPHPPGRHARE